MIKRHKLLEQHIEEFLTKKINNKEQIDDLIDEVRKVVDSEKYKNLLFDDLADLSSNVKIDVTTEMEQINNVIVSSINKLQEQNVLDEVAAKDIIRYYGLDLEEREKYKEIKWKHDLKGEHFTNLEDGINEFNSHEIKDKKLEKLGLSCGKTVDKVLELKEVFKKESLSTKAELKDINDKLSKQSESMNRAEKAFNIAEKELNTTNSSLKSSKATIERNINSLAEMNIISRFFSAKAKDLREINKAENLNIKQKTKDLVGDTEFYNQARTEKQSALNEYNQMSEKVGSLESIDNVLDRIDENLIKIQENITKMPNLIKLIDMKKVEIDKVNLELKDLSKDLKQMAKKYPHMDLDKNEAFDKLTKQYEALTSEKEFMQENINGLKNDYDEMQSTVDNCQKNILEAEKNKDSIFRASNHINSAHLESTKLVELGKTTLEKSKGILLQLGGAMLSLSTMGLANKYADKLTEKGMERVNEATTQYKDFLEASKEFKEQSKGVKDVTKENFEMNL